MRTRLVQQTNQYYDTELARINQIEDSEANLQNLREDNTLARIQALTQISDLENQFAAERIQNEERIADIQRGADISRRDLGTGFGREIEDLFIGFQREGLDVFGGTGFAEQIQAEIESGAGNVQNILRSTGFFSQGFQGRIGPGRSVETQRQLEDFIRQLLRDREDIAQGEEDSLEQLRLQSEQAIVDSNTTLATAITGLTSAITGTEPEELTPETEVGTGAIPETETDVAGVVSAAPTDPTADASEPDLSALTDFGVAARVASQDFALLTPAADHLIYFANEVPNYVESFEAVSGGLSGMATASEGVATRIEGAAARIESALQQLNDISLGGGQPIQIEVPVELNGREIARAVDRESVPLASRGGLVGNLRRE